MNHDPDTRCRGSSCRTQLLQSLYSHRVSALLYFYSRSISFPPSSDTVIQITETDWRMENRRLSVWHCLIWNKQQIWIGNGLYGYNCPCNHSEQPWEMRADSHLPKITVITSVPQRSEHVIQLTTRQRFTAG